MPVFAVVPVQRLETAKSRLSGILSPDQRRHLVTNLLETVLSALSTASRVDQIIVVSPDPDVLQRVSRPGVHPVQQPGRGLNDAIRLGRDRAVEQGASTLLVVLADLPRLSAGEIDDLLAIADSATVTMAPDRHGHGTNVLALRPPNAIEPAFGVGSFHKHMAEAQHLGLQVEIVRSAGMAFDVDTVDDLNDFGRSFDQPMRLRSQSNQPRRVLKPGQVAPSCDIN